MRSAHSGVFFHAIFFTREIRHQRFARRYAFRHRIFIKTNGVTRDKRAVVQVLADDDVHHRVHQRVIGGGQQRHIRIHLVIRAGGDARHHALSDVRADIAFAAAVKGAAGGHDGFRFLYLYRGRLRFRHAGLHKERRGRERRRGAQKVAARQPAFVRFILWG